jgi:hypothetical protein
MIDLVQPQVVCNFSSLFIKYEYFKNGCLAAEKVNDRAATCVQGVTLNFQEVQVQF